MPKQRIQSDAYQDDASRATHASPLRETMTYTPDIHHRNSIRLQSYDYRTAGAYFVTICMFQKEQILAEIAGREVRLTPLGEIVRGCGYDISQHFPDVELDEFVIMPNHLHAIFIIHDSVGARHASPNDNGKTDDVASSDNTTTDTTRATHASPLQRSGPPKRSLGAIVGSFKSACTKRINELRDTPGLPVWQRNYHERVIRHDNELHALRDYIQNNPARWEEDSEHPAQSVDAP